MGSCCSSNKSERSESHENLLSDEQEGEIINSRVIDRTRATQTVVSIPKKPITKNPPIRPVSYSDIPSPVNGLPPTNFMLVRTEKGREIVSSLKEAYSWKENYGQPTLEFSYKTNVLFTSCEQHLSTLSTNLTEENKTECDTIVRELLNLRAHWGTGLLPLSMRNAFVREKINVTAGKYPKQCQYRIDCIQFFEPVVFYGNSPGKQEDLVKLFVFVVNDVKEDEVVIRYYLERSFLFDFYHVLCFFKGNSRGQLKPYGTVAPSYWTVRQDMLENAKAHLESIVSEEKQSGLQPIAATFFPSPRNTGPVNV